MSGWRIAAVVRISATGAVVPEPGSPLNHLFATTHHLALSAFPAKERWTHDAGKRGVSQGSVSIQYLPVLLNRFDGAGHASSSRCRCGRPWVAANCRQCRKRMLQGGYSSNRRLHHDATALSRAQASTGTPFLSHPPVASARDLAWGCNFTSTRCVQSRTLGSWQPDRRRGREQIFGIASPPLLLVSHESGGTATLIDIEDGSERRATRPLG